MDKGDERTDGDSRQGLQSGYVYIAHNEFHDVDLFKIGKTERDPNERASELGSNTGVLGKFKILHSVYVDNCDEAEREVHKRLETYRVKANREFFKIPFKDAVSVVHETCLKFIITYPLERPGPWHIIQSNRDDARTQLNEAYETLRKSGRYTGSLPSGLWERNCISWGTRPIVIECIWCNQSMRFPTPQNPAHVVCPQCKTAMLVIYIERVSTIFFKRIS